MLVTIVIEVARSNRKALDYKYRDLNFIPEPVVIHLN